jgi:hypothetical protein
MRLRAGLGLLCVGLAGCQHLPEGVEVDLRNGTVSAGPCVCRLPAPPGTEEKQAEAPAEEPAPDDAEPR